MLVLSRDDDVDLTAAGGQGPKLALDAEEKELGYVAEIEAHSASVRSAILPDLEPNNVRFVREAPRLHDVESL
jgi:hypothetical protein